MNFNYLICRNFYWVLQMERTKHISHQSILQIILKISHFLKSFLQLTMHVNFVNANLFET